jgi:hypothetical protein
MNIKNLKLSQVNGKKQPINQLFEKENKVAKA